MTTRINVYAEYGELAGWFDRDDADSFDEATWWDGHNNISHATGSQWEHEILYRTAGARWVLHSWSQWQGSRERYEFISGDAARTWLLKNDHDEAVQRFFGPIESESGPGGEGGGDYWVSVEGLLPELDDYAAKRNASRESAVRSLLNKALCDSRFVYLHAYRIEGMGYFGQIREQGTKLPLWDDDVCVGFHEAAVTRARAEANRLGYRIVELDQ